MYINFEQLVSSGLSPNDLINLLAIRQKEDMIIKSISERDIEKYHDLGFTECLKNGSIRLTNKGTSFISVVETPRLTEDISDTLSEMISMYGSYGKEIGVSKLEAQDRLSWFMCSTNFRKDLIIDVMKSYIQDSDKYTLSLCNFIWKPSSVYSIHMNLKESKLFDLISKRYEFDTSMYFKESQNKLIKWLFAVSRLPDPPTKGEGDYLFTKSAKEDKERLIIIKKYLLKELRKWKQEKN